MKLLDFNLEEALKDPDRAVRFYDSNSKAMQDMERCANMEKQTHV